MSLALSTCVLLISLMKLMNGTQFLNITPLFLLSICLAFALSPAPVIVTFHPTSMYASL